MTKTHQALGRGLSTIAEVDGRNAAWWRELPVLGWRIPSLLKVPWPLPSGWRRKGAGHVLPLVTACLISSEAGIPVPHHSSNRAAISHELPTCTAKRPDLRI
jgi:hypothetical protein